MQNSVEFYNSFHGCIPFSTDCSPNNFNLDKSSFITSVCLSYSKHRIPVVALDNFYVPLLYELRNFWPNVFHQFLHLVMACVALFSLYLNNFSFIICNSYFLFKATNIIIRAITRVYGPQHILFVLPVKSST